jgi:Uma2 family endonuclease
MGESLTVDEFLRIQECADLHIEYDEGLVYTVVPVLGDHADVHSNLMFLFRLTVGDRGFKVTSEPYGLKIGDSKYLLPDIQVIEDTGALPDLYFDGAPRVVVEILSPSTARRDLRDKRDSYLALGVPEYWVVDPKKRILDIHLLQEGKYTVHRFMESGVIDCGLIGAFDILANYIYSGTGIKVRWDLTDD